MVAAGPSPFGIFYMVPEKGGLYIYILHVYNCIYNIYGSDIVVHELNGKDMK